MSRLAPLALLLLACGTADAEPVVSIRRNGPDENRVNIAILGDGYAQGDQVKYSSDVDRLVQAMFEQAPYQRYAPYFNVNRVDVVSAESGASHPASGVRRNTELGAAFDCAGIQRLVCVNTGAVNTIVSRSLPSVARDIVVVLVNDPEYGGSGGSFTVLSTHTAAVELLLHESGHSFGLLGDEYETTPPPCVNTVEPPQPNIAREIGRDRLKWAAWVDAATPLPTSATGSVGAYEGALFCASGLFRPTQNSKMRSLGVPFEAVNAEQLIRRIYNFVSPVDSSEPAAPSLAPARGAAVEFSVQPMQPASEPLLTTWRVDGAVTATGTSFRLQSAFLAAGTHTVEVAVVDSTSAVRNDPGGLLTGRRTWTLSVQASTADDVKRALEDVFTRWRNPR